MKKIKINNETYVLEDEVINLKEKIGIYEKILELCCPFLEDVKEEWNGIDGFDIRCILQEYKKLGKITDKSRAWYESEIERLNREIGKEKARVARAKRTALGERYGSRIIPILKGLKDELNEIDFDNMTGSMDL